jgi:glutamate/tyrosine decarboxylase-like PLP-dependent enzyme
MTQMSDDYANLAALLSQVVTATADFHSGLSERPVGARQWDKVSDIELPGQGVGGAEALREFLIRHGADLSGSVGPRYLGYVTGGTTPAAMAGDWLAAAIDQNAASPGDSSVVAVTVQTLDWLKQLFNLPSDAFDGAFTTGATGANFASLLIAREWAGEQVGYNIAQRGLAGAPPIAIYSACPHSSFIKVTRYLGLGEQSIRPVARLGDTEAMDPAALEKMLASAPPEEQKIVCASAGTVTTNAFDDLVAISSISKRHNAWLHVDGAFGLFARIVPELAYRTSGIERADSITVDAHKWLNVPYDSGFYFTRRIDLIERATGALPAYLDVEGKGLPHYVNRALESSQRFRALPVWMTLAAYGAAGVRDIVRRNCDQAQTLAKWIEASPDFELLAPTTLNVVCFRALPVTETSDADAGANIDIDSWNHQFLKTLNETGDVFMTPGAYGGKTGIRAAFSNWTTAKEDLDRVTKAMHNATQMMAKPQ